LEPVLGIQTIVTFSSLDGVLSGFLGVVSSGVEASCFFDVVLSESFLSSLLEELPGLMEMLLLFVVSFGELFSTCSNELSEKLVSSQEANANMVATSKVRKISSVFFILNPSVLLFKYVPNAKRCFIVHLIISGLFGVLNPPDPLFPISGKKGFFNCPFHLSGCSGFKGAFYGRCAEPELHISFLQN